MHKLNFHAKNCTNIDSDCFYVKFGSGTVYDKNFPCEVQVNKVQIVMALSSFSLAHQQTYVTHLSQVADFNDELNYDSLDLFMCQMM